MSAGPFWFRNDLRLHDQPALHAALTSGATHLLPVVCLPAGRLNPRPGVVPAWACTAAHSPLPRCAGWVHAWQRWATRSSFATRCSSSALPALARALGATTVVCEDIAAPYEQAEVAALRAAGLQVRTVWHSSLLHPADMPWPAFDLPGVFTSFRQKVERAGIAPAAPTACARSAPAAARPAR